MKRFFLGTLLVVCAPAFAQFGGFDIGKALDIGKKAVQASKDFTQEEEIQSGDAATASFLGASPIHKDANLQRYVNPVGKGLALHSDRPDLPWTFAVIDTETINAFALPGGSILVSSGLLKRLSSEAELAGVLAHEVAHVVKKHQITAIQSAAKGNLAKSIGTEIASDRIGSRGGVAARTPTALPPPIPRHPITPARFLLPPPPGRQNQAPELA